MNLIDKKSYNILIVEDNPGDFVILEDLLFERIARPKIYHSKNFNEASDYLLRSGVAYDVVLLDLTLPDKEGGRLVTEMLALAGNSPIIVLTSYADFDFSIQSIELGIADYLLKEDLTPDLLYRTMVYAIQRTKTSVALKLSEKRYSDLFHFSPEPVIVCDASDLHILSVNQAAVRKYGYDEESLLKMKFSDLEAEMEGDESDHNTVLGKHIFFDHVRHRKKNGELFYADVNESIIAYGEMEVKIIIATDISNMIAYMRTIESYSAKLKEIAWMQSHSVRAPLARMMGIVNILKRQGVNAKDFEEWVGHFEDSAKEFDSIIWDITQKSNLVETDTVLLRAR